MSVPFLIPGTSAEFCEHGFDLLIPCEAALGCRAQAAVDASKFFRRGLVFATLESGIEFKCEFGKLVLDLGRPCLDAFQNFVQFFWSS